MNGMVIMLIDFDCCMCCDDCVWVCVSVYDNNLCFFRYGLIYDWFMVVNVCMYCIDLVCMIECLIGVISC